MKIDGVFASERIESNLRTHAEYNTNSIKIIPEWKKKSLPTNKQINLDVPT